MNYTKSTIKTDKEGFNCCPARRDIKNGLKDISSAKIVDVTDKEYWQNESDTLVVLVDNANDALQLGQFAKNFDADEFNFEAVDNNNSFIVRLWWD